MTYADEVLADHPLVYCRTGEASGTVMADSSGYGRNGAYSGSFTLGVGGLLTSDADKAVQFTATSARGSFPQALWQFQAVFSVEVWVKTTAASLYNSMVGIYSAAAGSNHWIFRLQNGKPEFAIGFGSGTDLVGPTAINDGKVHHVVATYDGAKIVLYVDGVQVASAAASGSDAATGTAALSVGNPNGYVGTLDEFAYYDSALSPARVSAHYLTGTTVQGPTYSTSTSLTATGQLSATGVVTGGGSPAYSASADRAGTGQLIAAGSPAVDSAGDLAGAGTVAVSGIPAVASTGALLGSGVLEVASTSELVGAAELDGLGLLATASVPFLLADGALDSSGGLVATGSPGVFAELVLGGLGELLVGEDRDITISASLRGGWQAEVHAGARTAQAGGGWTARSRG